MERSATCDSSICGNSELRAHLADSPAKSRKREAELEAKRQSEAESKQAAALAKSEREYKKTASKLAEAVREVILKGADEEAFEDPATIGKTMSQAEATEFNIKQAALFCRQNPNYPLSRNNLQVIEGYLQRNGIAEIVSAATLEKAVRRLDSYGLIERSAPIPIPPSPPPARVNLPAELVPIGPATPTTRRHVGEDADGREREFTDIEVERMSAREFKNAFRLTQPDLETARAWGRR
jgi:hypothetical protein